MEAYELKIDKSNQVITTSPKRDIKSYYLVPDYDKRELRFYREERGGLVDVTGPLNLGIEAIFGSHDEGRVSFRRLKSPDDDGILRKIESIGKK
jgi:hypothetical protein